MKDSVLGEVKGNYELTKYATPHNRNLKRAGELYDQAARQVTVSRTRGLQLEWTVRENDLAMWKHLLKDFAHNIEFNTYKYGVDMARYAFMSACLPSRNPRTNDIICFLSCMQKACNRPGWCNAHGDEISLTEKEILTSLKYYERGDDWNGGAMLLSSAGDAPLLIAKIGVGGEWARSFFSVDFPDDGEVPDIKHVRAAIECVQPVHACVTDADQYVALADAYPLPPALRNKRVKPPRSIYWYNYFNFETVAELGGERHCLATPAYRTSAFLGGVIIQLTNAPFDKENPQHLAAQVEANRHLQLCGFWPKD